MQVDKRENTLIPTWLPSSREYKSRNIGKHHNMNAYGALYYNAGYG